MADPKNTETINTDAGHLAVHVSGVHAPDLTFSFERPQSGVGGCGPSPRKLKVAAEIMVVAKMIDACTMIGAATLGRMCRVRIRRTCAPMLRAAMT